MGSSPVFLTELLNSLPELSIDWLSEKPKANIPINWVSLSPRNLQPRDVLIISASNLSQDLINLAQERSASAVLLVGEFSSGHIIIPIGLTVAVIPDGLDIQILQKQLIDAIIFRREALFEKGMRIQTQLSKIIAEGGGLFGIARYISDTSGHGLLIQDKRMRILADCPSVSLSSVWTNVLEDIISIDLLPDVLHDRKKAGQEAAILSQEIPGNLVRLVTPIVVGEVARGYLSLICQKGELDELDHLVIHQGATVCAIEMARIKSIREVEKRLQGDLLEALLQDNITPRDAGLWMQTLDMDEHSAHIALRFCWDGPSPPSRRRLETIINGEISRRSIKIVINSFAGEVVCFCQVYSMKKRPEMALEFAKDVISQGRVEYPQTPIRCGIGKPAADFYNWRNSFRQAGQALELARRLQGTIPFYFPDLSVFRLLMQLEDSPELIAFLEETIGSLLANENANELITTLEAYYTHRGNVSQTAEDLFIHRNTLIYRLDRISKIMNIDLENPETNLAIQLAFHIYRMMGLKSN